jgi:hypothetical protein
VRGYGLDICDLEDKVIEQDIVEIGAIKLIEIAKDTGQWFYDLDCYDDIKGIHFGLFDSSALFIDGESERIQNVLEVFEKVESI